MTTKRRAELQRKLSMASIPKPPEGLAQRIKNDIPADLAGAPPARAARPLLSRIDLRIAASILLLAGSTYLGVRLLTVSTTPTSRRPTMITRPSSDIGMQARREEAPPPPSAPLPRTASTETITEAIALGSGAPAASGPERRQPAAIADDAHQNAVAERADTPARQANAPAIADAIAPAAPPPPSVAAEVAAGASGTVGAVSGAKADRRPETITVTASAPAIAEQRVLSKTESSDADVPTQQRRRETLFGLSVDESAFARVKSSIDRGERPSSSDIDVQAIINYFGGTTRSAASVALDVEGSAAPVGAESYVVRFSIDTPHIPNNGVVASAAHVEVAFDPGVIASQRRVGGDLAAQPAETLHNGVSVTAVYEVTLKEGAAADRVAANVRLTWRDAGGRPHSESRIVKVAEVERPWSTASRRHRLASVAALWGQMLQVGIDPAELARKAEELARQEPRDTRARELASAATASVRLQSSGPTGSGR